MLRSLSGSAQSGWRIRVEIATLCDGRVTPAGNSQPESRSSCFSTQERPPPAVMRRGAREGPTGGAHPTESWLCNLPKWCFGEAPCGVCGGKRQPCPHWMQEEAEAC